jgi:hypothetical protein
MLTFNKIRYLSYETTADVGSKPIAVNPLVAIEKCFQINLFTCVCGCLLPHAHRGIGVVLLADSHRTHRGNYDFRAIGCIYKFTNISSPYPANTHVFFKES